MEIKKVVTGALEENCYILTEGDSCILIDPGSESKKIKEAMQGASLQAILVTHAHFDHIGALRDFLVEHPKVPIYKKSNLKDQEELELGSFRFQVFFTPGHSSDSVSFYFADAGILFTGDFLFRDTVGRSDLPTGSEEEMQASLKKLEKFPNDLKIYSGHGMETTLERERQMNPYMQ